MAVDIYDFSKFGYDIKKVMQDIPTPQTMDFTVYPTLAEINDAFISCSRAWGKPFGFRQEQNGAIVQDIFPIKANEDEQISSSSKKELEMHTETAFHQWLPQYVFLLCLRGDENAGTTFVDIVELLSNLSPDDVEILHSDIFTTSIDMSFLSDSQTDSSITLSILKNNASSIRYDKNLMRSSNPEGQAVLDKIARLTEELKYTVYLQAGQMAVIENWRTIHGRTVFTPRYDGTDRWLKRILVRRSMPLGFDVDVDQEADTYVVKTVL